MKTIVNSDKLQCFVNSDDFINLCNMLKEFHKSYVKHNDSGSSDIVIFKVTVEHKEKHFRTFDNKPCIGVSRDLYCNLSGESGHWDIHYSKRQIDEIGISDSAVYKFFSSMLSKYKAIVVEGSYNPVVEQYVEIQNVDILD